MKETKKRISILTMSMGSGGAERVIQRLLELLVNDYEVYLYMIYNDVYYEIPEQVTIRSLYKDSHNHYFRGFRSVFECSFGYKKFLIRNNIDYSISFTFRPNIINASLKNKLPGVKFILSERDYPSGFNRKSFLSSKFHGWLRTNFYNKADRLFSNSLYINKALYEDFGIRVPMDVLYNPIKIPKEVAHLEEKDRLKIITIGRFDKAKNHFLLLRTLVNTINCFAEIWGDGSLRLRYEEFIKDNNLGQIVTLPGKTKNVNAKLICADVFVLTSNTEGFPNVLLEAMSVGLPVISTNCLSGPLEMLNDNEDVVIPKGSFVKAKYGLLINPEDEDGLVNALQFYSNLSNRKEYALKARNRAESYNLPKIYNEFISIIEK